MTRRCAVAWSIAALSTVALLGAAPPALADSATVLRVLDGDSLRVTGPRGPRTVDLLGVRAPRAGACFAVEARRALARRLPRGSRVRLLADRSRGGRGRYVFRGTVFINASVLRAGAGRAARLSGLRRAATLRAASRSAWRLGRGVFGACDRDAGGTTPGGGTGPAGPSPGVPAPTAPGSGGPGAPVPAPPAAGGRGAAETAAAVRAALVGRQLLDLSSDASSSTRNTTRFCAGNRADRTEEFNGTSGFLRNELTGTWAVLGTLRQNDGSLIADVLFSADDGSFDPRVITISVSQDGTVRREGANASELQAGGPCAPAQPDGTLENDTAAARSEALQQLVGKRLEAADGSLTADFCSATRALQRERGAVVVDGPWTVEWAASAPQILVAALILEDERSSASRRLLVVLPSAGQAQLQDLGAGEAAKPAALAAPRC
jgi:endonuclease YncB( thermonuclease family)